VEEQESDDSDSKGPKLSKEERVKKYVQREIDPKLRVDFSTRWAEVNSLLKDHSLWKKAEPFDRLIAYEEFIREQDRQEIHLRR